jgi:hypothetical protein
MKSCLLIIFIVILSSASFGCGGFGLGPGGDMGMIPSAVDVENPAKKGTITGELAVAEGFLPLFLEYVGSADAEGFSDIYKHIKVQIIGASGNWSASLNEEGKFKFPPIYSGRYILKVQYKSHLLFYHDIVLLDKNELDMKITVVGYDLADLNKNGNRFELLYEIQAKLSENEVEYFRLTNPDGSADTILPDGTREFARNGLVRILNNNGQIEYRKDFDNDFVPDNMDFDDDNDGIGDKRDRDLGNNGIPDKFERKIETNPADKNFLLGKTSIPLITSGYAIIPGDRKRPLSELITGDVILFSAQTETGGGTALAEVNIRIYSFGRPVFSFKLHDDGSEKDLLETWPGIQISGDRIKGDGRFTSIIPVDEATIAALDNSLLLFEGRNTIGEKTNSFILPMTVSVARKEPSNIERPSLSYGVSDFGLYKTDGNQLTARIDVEGSVAENLSARLITPSEDTKLLSFSGRKDSLFSFSSSSLDYEKGLYILIAKSSSGGVFYAGFRMGDNM